MQRKDGTKKRKLMLRKEPLRRLTRELTERQLERALGGTDDGGGMHQQEWTVPDGTHTTT
jgi:Na+/phosphate symporter